MSSLRARRASVGENVARRIDDLYAATPADEPSTSPTEKTEKTIKYLAYGSNLSAKTFLGRRGIRPLAQINVIVPELRLVFDLAGIPYWEPRFANVQWRNKDNNQTINESEDGEEFVRRYLANPSSFSTLLPEGEDNGIKGLEDRPLIGVVYEVTEKDYYHIIATEGGYDQVSVQCYALPNSSDSSDNTTITGEKTFEAMTLLAPPRVTRTSNGQPSPRYLGLITTGAAEHDLPSTYQEYLNSLEPYTKTERRQTIGGVLFAVTWAPAIMSMMWIRQLFGNKDGSSPDWIVKYMNVIVKSAWITYDGIWKKVWGDGEVTQKKKGERIDEEGGEKRALKRNEDVKGYGSI